MTCYFQVCSIAISQLHLSHFVSRFLLSRYLKGLGSSSMFQLYSSMFHVLKVCNSSSSSSFSSSSSLSQGWNVEVLNLLNTHGIGVERMLGIRTHCFRDHIESLLKPVLTLDLSSSAVLTMSDKALPMASNSQGPQEPETKLGLVPVQIQAPELDAETEIMGALTPEDLFATQNDPIEESQLLHSPAPGSRFDSQPAESQVPDSQGDSQGDGLELAPKDDTCPGSDDPIEEFTEIDENDSPQDEAASDPETEPEISGFLALDENFNVETRGSVSDYSFELMNVIQNLLGNQSVPASSDGPSVIVAEEGGENDDEQGESRSSTDPNPGSRRSRRMARHDRLRKLRKKKDGQ